MRRNIIIVALSTLIAAQSVGAVEQRIAEEWTAKLQRTSTLLKAGQHAEALPILENLMREMLDLLGPGDRTTYVLAVPLIQRAIAEAGQGDRARALWHWHMAQTMYPKAADADLSMFGAPGAFLKANRLVQPRMETCPTMDPTLTPPRVINRVAPIYPKGIRELGPIIIHAKVSADGTLREPRIVRPLATPLVYSALEALGSWTFAPATKGGVPVETGFCLTVNYTAR